MTPGTSTVSSTPGFNVGVPGDWVIVDFETPDDVDALAGVVDQRVSDGLVPEDARDDVVALVTRIATDAFDSGVRFAAALVTHDGGGLVVASVTVGFHVLSPPEDVDADVDDVELTEPLDSSVVDRTEAGSPGAVTESNAARSRVTLPGGPAVRIERVMAYSLGEGHEQDVYSVQYVLPVADGGLSLVLTGTSPAIRRKADLDRVFGEIAETLEIER
jgi:hypothetical protein